MAVRQIPEPEDEKSYPFGTNGSFTFDNKLSSGVYKVSVTGDDSFSASTNALTVTSPDGYVVPIHLDTGEGVVSLPFDENNTINAASVAIPTIVSFSKVKYEQGDPIENLTVSFDPSYSGSYVVNGSSPIDTTSIKVYYDDGTYDEVSSSLPASFTNPTFDTGIAFISGSLAMGITYVDNKGLDAKGLATNQNYPTPPGAYASTGGTIYTSDGYRYHKFTSNGTINFVSGGEVEYLIVAGGGGGGGPNNSYMGGGGGAGGYLSGSFSTSTGNIDIYIGAAGSRGYASSGSKGGDSWINGISSASATGGGGGGGQNAPGGAGGSGGGGGSHSSSGGSGISGQGYPGSSAATSRGGGGGGAGESGATDGASHGGDGLNSASVWALATSSGDNGYYAGGGGGGYALNDTSTGGPGGEGGGGNGGGWLQNGSSAQANTGGGGGGAGGPTRIGGYGGSGIIILRYAI